MVENAKSAIETETMSFAYGPKTVENARIVSWTPETSLPVAGSTG